MSGIRQLFKQNDKQSSGFVILIKAIAAVLSCCVVLIMAIHIAQVKTWVEPDVASSTDGYQITACFDRQIAPVLADAKQELYAHPKIFWINEDEETVPVPDQRCYGKSDDPSTLQWLLDDAEATLGVKDTLFSVNAQLYPGSEVTYYLDESIFAVTWREVHNNYVYTISEIKISHPSQLRRYVTGKDEFYTTSKMSQMTNAVVAASGDFYKCRDMGITVTDGQLIRVRSGSFVDTCFVDRSGDLHFTYAGEITTSEQAQAYIDEHDIQFSLSFGPVLIDNGTVCTPDYYPLGEIHDRYSRAAFGQRGELHYVVVTANAEGRYWKAPTIREFATVLETFGCSKFYALDGGQTGSIAMNGQLMNPVAKQYTKGERLIPDFIYFATAVPNTHSSTND